jgi:hypothetical protein
MTIFSSSVTWGVVILGIGNILNTIAPTLPAPYAALVTAIVGIITLYVHKGQIVAGSVKSAV